jgi:ribonuclease HI
MVDVTHIWSLYFDGSKSKEGDGVGCVLIDPTSNKTLIACRLEFECTNNMAEYEALLQGLRKALDLKIHNLMVFDDSEIVVRQVRNSIHCLSPHLKSYQDEVWNLMYKLFAFNINSIPILNNSEAELFANVASKLFPAEGLLDHQSQTTSLIGECSIMINRSSVSYTWKTLFKVWFSMKALTMKTFTTSR